MTDGLRPRGRAHVLTVSDRSAAGTREDASGPLAVELLRQAGFEVEAAIVPDGERSVAEAIGAAVAAGAGFVVTTGGTGVSPTDRTPEGTRLVVDRELPGVAEEIRRRGAQDSPHAVLTRGVAGVVDAGPRSASGVFVVNLPGRPAAVLQGLEAVLPLVDHVGSQLRGGDH